VEERAVQFDVPGLGWSAGVPQPFIVSSEERTLIGFYARGEDAEQRNSDAVTVAELVGCTSVKFGFPNDEVLDGHRLDDPGLGYYEPHEVDNSAWLIELRARSHRSRCQAGRQLWHTRPRSAARDLRGP
jgi:hypothetical protein